MSAALEHRPLRRMRDSSVSIQTHFVTQPCCQPAERLCRHHEGHRASFESNHSRVSFKHRSWLLSCALGSQRTRCHAAQKAMQALRLTSTLFGKDIRMMWSLKDQYVKDHEDVRCMLTVVVRVRATAPVSASLPWQPACCIIAATLCYTLRHFLPRSRLHQLGPTLGMPAELLLIPPCLRFPTLRARPRLPAMTQPRHGSYGMRFSNTVCLQHVPNNIRLRDLESKFNREFGETLRSHMRQPRHSSSGAPRCCPHRRACKCTKRTCALSCKATVCGQQLCLETGSRLRASSGHAVSLKKVAQWQSVLCCMQPGASELTGACNASGMPSP